MTVVADYKIRGRAACNRRHARTINIINDGGKKLSMMTARR
jgi:hypothetical protein